VSVQSNNNDITEYLESIKLHLGKPNATCALNHKTFPYFSIYRQILTQA